MSNGYSSALVTGGAGFIGSHICEALLEKDYRVVCLDNLVNGKIENIAHLMGIKNFTFIKEDVTDYDRIEKYFKDIDVVFHEACSKNTVCLTNPRLDLTVNIIGTFNVLEAARVHGIRKIVHASTGSVFGDPIILPENEDHPLNPVSFYGTSKLAGEKYCFAFSNIYQMDITALRYFHVYGPRQDDSDKGGVVSIFMKKLLKNERPYIYGDGTQLRSFTYVKDVVAANLFAASEPRAKNQVYIVASGLKISINDLLNNIKGLLGKSDIMPIYQDWRKGDIKVFDVDNSKIKSLGFDFKYSFSQGLYETAEWMKTQYIGNKNV
jgi:nucleoside-diphosphate-sugar epimerase